MNDLMKATPAVGAINVAQAQTQVVNFFDPAQFEVLQRICKMYTYADLVPDAYKASEKNPMEKAVANCMIAIEVANRIGASPLMVMQNMVPIYGKPSWSATFLIGTVNGCGRFAPLKYRFTEKGMLGMVEYTDYEYQGGRKTAVKKQFDGKKIMDIECVAYTTANGSDQVLESAPVSIRLAIQEGWYTKAGSKWQTMAKQMLMYRAASWWTRTYAPELSLGMKTIDEQQDIYTDYEEVKDVKEQVAAEKEANANQTTIQIDLGDEVPATVDAQTGEIIGEEPKAPEATPSSETLPGF